MLDRELIIPLALGLVLSLVAHLAAGAGLVVWHVRPDESSWTSPVEQPKPADAEETTEPEFPEEPEEIELPDGTPPDLVVLSMQTSEPRIAGRPTRLAVRVANRGDTAGADTHLAITLDGKPVELAALDRPLLGGTWRGFEFELMVGQPGTHEVVAVIDPDDAVAERDETNNTMTRRWRWQGDSSTEVPLGQEAPRELAMNFISYEDYRKLIATTETEFDQPVVQQQAEPDPAARQAPQDPTPPQPTAAKAARPTPPNESSRKPATPPMPPAPETPAEPDAAEAAAPPSTEVAEGEARLEAAADSMVIGESNSRTPAADLPLAAADSLVDLSEADDAIASLPIEAVERNPESREGDIDGADAPPVAPEADAASPAPEKASEVDERSRAQRVANTVVTDAEAPPEAEQEAPEAQRPPSSPPTPTESASSESPPAEASEPQPQRPSDPTAAPRDEREAPPVSELTGLEVQPGEVIAAAGVRINTVAARFSVIARMTAVPVNPKARITFDHRTGKVIKAELTRSSSYPNIDGPVLSSLYKWTAEGANFDRLEEPLTIDVAIILTRKK